MAIAEGARNRIRRAEITVQDVLEGQALSLAATRQTSQNVHGPHRSGCLGRFAAWLILFRLARGWSATTRKSLCAPIWAPGSGSSLLTFRRPGIKASLGRLEVPLDPEGTRAVAEIGAGLNPTVSFGSRAYPHTAVGKTPLLINCSARGRASISSLILPITKRAIG